MNTPGPQFAFNTGAPPLPPGMTGNNFPPNMQVAAPLAPVAVDWNAKAMEVVQAKVYIDSKPITAPQMVVWAMNEIVKRMGNPPEAAKRLCEAMEKSTVGSVNLGNDNEEQLTYDQRNALTMELIPTRLVWKGAACVGTPDYLGQVMAWLWASLPVVASLSDNEQKMTALYNWMKNLPAVYELDDATRAAANQQAPANPISDQTTAQIPKPAEVVVPIINPPAGEAAAGEDKDDPVYDPTDGYKCKNLRGLKTRATKTHKTEWPTFCVQHGLDPKTGHKMNGTPVAGGPVSAPATVTPPASPPLPALVGQGAPVNAPTVVQHVSTGIVHPVIPVTNNPPPLYVAPGQPSPEYVQAQKAAAEVMPIPPAQQPTTPVSFTPVFQPTPAAVPPAQLHYQAATPVVTVPAPVITPTFQTPAAQQLVPNHPPVGNMGIGLNVLSPVGMHVGSPVGRPPEIIVQQVAPGGWNPPTIQPQPATGVPAGMDRAQMAQMLGGPVRLVVCRVLEINNVNVQGLADVNQLAELAKKMARDELRITDLAEAAYGKGSQTAQRHFADLLTKYQQCYLLMNGFEFMIADGFLEILIARTVHIFHVSQRDGNIEIKF